MTDESGGTVDPLRKFFLCQTTQLSVIRDFQTHLQIFYLKFAVHAVTSVIWYSIATVVDMILQ